MSKTAEDSKLSEEQKQIDHQELNDDWKASDTVDAGSTHPPPKIPKDALMKPLLKALEEVATPEGKIAVACTHYLQASKTLKKHEKSLKTGTANQQRLTKEKQSLQTQLEKANTAKVKLENLCRELQRHNKAIKDEYMNRIKEEETKRQAIASKFQTTIDDITNQIQEQSEKNVSLQDQNAELSKKLKGLLEQYDVREEHVEKLFKQKQLEVQLYEAKFNQINKILTEERSRYDKAKELFLAENNEQKRKCELLTKNEAELKKQLLTYTEKFQEFQKSIDKSNDIFITFKKETESASKNIKRLEKEVTVWKTKWENTNRAFLEMTGEKLKQDKEHENFKAKFDRLKSLCHALQEERNQLRQKVADYTKKKEPNTTSSEKDKNSLATDDSNGNNEMPSNDEASNVNDHDTNTKANNEITGEEEHDSTTTVTDKVNDDATSSLIDS